MANPLEVIHLFRTKKKIEDAESQKELYEIIRSIEDRLGFIKSTLYDNGFFLLLPGTYKETTYWSEALEDYGSPNKDEIEKLFKKGFVIFDRHLLSERTLVDIFDVFDFDNNELLLDKDYGLVILPEKSLKKRNFYLGMLELERYISKYPQLRNSLSDIFSIGALRVHTLLTGKLGFLPIEIEVKTKTELLNYISFLQKKLVEANSRFQIWFRGQTSEYFLDKIDDELLMHCPWRSYQDVSLIPSIFRKSESVSNDLKSYAEKLIEILNYEMGLNMHLDVPQYEIRENEFEEYKEYFKGTVWEDSNSPMQSTLTDSKDEIQEIHDYNPIYRALQSALFLQHYGIPTNILDITKDINIALYFAQNKLINSKYKKTENVDSSVIYLFLLDPKTDRFLDSTELLEIFNVQRPIRQKCGVLAGASFSNQNYYSKFISIRFKLKCPIDYDEHLTNEFVMPRVEDDHILDFLISHSEKHNLNRVKPL